MSDEENFGVAQRARVFNYQGPPFDIVDYPDNYVGCVSMHQGGIVQIQSGEWWGWSMLDFNSVGRVTGLSPITWEDGWPYFGLPGNLTRSPRTWIKPNTGFDSPSGAPFSRNDDFSGPELNKLWQWNHVPVNGKWSLTERTGYLRLNALPANSFWRARNSLTQRGIGPESIATAELDVSGLEQGDIAGLALLNLLYAWGGVSKHEGGNLLRFYHQQTPKAVSMDLSASTVYLRAYRNFETDIGYLVLQHRR